MTYKKLPLPEPDPQAKFKPGDFDVVLQNIPPHCVLIGGQAVAWWAERYSIKNPAGDRVEATSKDIDFWGSRDDLFQIATRLNKAPVFPDPREMTLLIGAIEVSVAGKKTVLEMLRRVPGLDVEDPNAVALPEAIASTGSETLILTPVSLVLTKLHGLRRFPQNDRQDLLHLQISLAACQEFLSEVVLRDTSYTLWNCNRLIRASQESRNQRLERKYLFRILSAIPIANMRAAAERASLPGQDRERLQRFLKLQWPRITGGCRAQD